MINTRKWLEGIYLPGYVGLTDEDYSGNCADFSFNPIEPPVTILSGRYLTPRGLHIFLSQGGICYVENLIGDGRFEDLNIETFRGNTEEGRLKIVELNQRFRREVGLTHPLQGRFVLTRLRQGRVPLIKIDFSVDNKSITGNMTGVIAPSSVPQLNEDILR